MLLFDATHRSLRPVVAQLQQAGRSGRGAALYSECLAALEQARAMGDDAAQVLIAQTFGLVIDQDGYSDASIAWLLEAVECAKRCGEFGEQSHVLYLVGRAYYSRAEYGVALGYWTDGMEIAKRDGDRISWSWCKLGIGQICDALDAPAMAVKVFTDLGTNLAKLDSSTQRLPLTQWARFDLRLRELKAVNTVNLGVNQMHMGQYDDALISLRLGQTMAQTQQMEDIASECLVRIAEVAALQGEPAKALELLVPAQRALKACSHFWGLATMFLLRAQCQSALGQLPDAKVSIGSARSAAQKANAKHIAMRIERENALIAEKAGDLAQALASLKTAATLQTELDRGSKAHLLRHLQTLAEQSATTDRELPGYSMGVRRKLVR
jgi:tetratricopeptide (TPR) repeat protein